MLQRRLPLAVLKPGANVAPNTTVAAKVATALTACGIETDWTDKNSPTGDTRLQRRLPLAVLKLNDIIE